MEWISVKDRLPEENGKYLIIGSWQTPTTAYWHYGEWVWDELFTITHFINLNELPEPPK